MRALPVFYFLLGILQVTAKETESNIFQVFLLAGQSNMQGQGVVDMDHPKYYNGGKGTLVRIMEQTKTPRLFNHLRDSGGPVSYTHLRAHET